MFVRHYASHEVSFGMLTKVGKARFGHCSRVGHGMVKGWSKGGTGWLRDDHDKVGYERRGQIW